MEKEGKEEEKFLFPFFFLFSPILFFHLPHPHPMTGKKGRFVFNFLLSLFLSLLPSMDLPEALSELDRSLQRNLSRRIEQERNKGKKINDVHPGLLTTYITWVTLYSMCRKFAAEVRKTFGICLPHKPCLTVPALNGRREWNGGEEEGQKK